MVLKVVYYDMRGGIQDESDCDECGVKFDEGVMLIIGEILDEVSGQLVPECKLFCSDVCSDTWSRRNEWGPLQ